MPAGDGTGPLGMGPMTGHGAGYCISYAGPGYTNPVFRRGLGIGFGRGGRGRRNRFCLTGWEQNAFGYPYGGNGYNAMLNTPNFSIDQQIELLKGQAGYFEESLKNIKEQIEGLENKKDK